VGRRQLFNLCGLAFSLQGLYSRLDGEEFAASTAEVAASVGRVGELCAGEFFVQQFKTAAA
jgi:hypothetical protein